MDEDSIAPGRSALQSSAFSALAGSRGVKRSNGASTSGRPRKVPKYDFAAIAKGLTATAPPAQLHETDDLILKSAQIIHELGNHDGVEGVDAASRAAKELRELWLSAIPSTGEGKGLIGPSKDAPPLAKANFLASLLLQLYHPTDSDTKSDHSSSRFARSSRALIRQHAPIKNSPVPRVLLDWLNKYHDPDASKLEEVLSQEGHCSHPDFWDVVFGSVMRGKFDHVIRLLEDADWTVAQSALEDGHSSPGYEGQQLSAVRRAVSQAVQVLEACPAVTDGDWSVTGAEWFLFRNKVANASEELRAYAEGKSHDREAEVDEFAAEGFGISARSTNQGISSRSRKAESIVPWTIYENILDFYGQLLGNNEEILKSAFDWVEAVIGLSVWWNGEENVPQESLKASTRTLGQSLTRSQHKQHSRMVDVTPGAAYRERLAWALEHTLDQQDDSLAMNPTSPNEVGLACIFDNDVANVIRILSKFSMTITESVAEVATAGGWFPGPKTTAPNLLRSFNPSELAMFNLGQDSHDMVKKDDILLQYANLLFKKPMLQSSGISKEGWELAIEILGHSDSDEFASTTIGELLDRLPLNDSVRVDKVLFLCRGLGLLEHAERIAEVRPSTPIMCRNTDLSQRYADSIATESFNYGDALYYYACAHMSDKIREVLDILVSCCLVQSMAYPPASELDARLKALLESPRQTVNQLARVDPDAAECLSTYLSGYATIRRFYDLRDEGANLKPGEEPKLGTSARKQAAAAALVAAINSASDSIKGGLYDSGVDVVLPVDGLLALFGEALPFVNRKHPFPTLTLMITHTDRHSRIEAPAHSSTNLHAPESHRRPVGVRIIIHHPQPMRSFLGLDIREFPRG